VHVEDIIKCSIKIKSILVLLVMSLIVLYCIVHLTAQENTANQFAYLESSKPEVMNFVDPATGYVFQKPFPIEMNFHTLAAVKGYGSYLSPLGDWVATFTAHNQERLLHLNLWNLVTLETRSIPLKEWDYVNPELQNMAWSPNGKMIALTIGEQLASDAGDIELYVYDLTSGNLVKVTDDTYDQSRIYWSDDSNYVLTFTRPCALDVSCAYELNAYSLQGTKTALDQTILLDKVLGLGSFACDAKMSPDNRYITFVSVCLEGYALSTGLPSEIYIWDKETKSLNQLTDFGTDAYASNESSWELYQYHWLDAKTLLVGVDYKIGMGETRTSGQALVLYHPDLTSEIVSKEYGANFIYSPITQKLLVSPIMSPLLEQPKESTTPLSLASISSLLTQDTSKNTLAITSSYSGGVSLYCKALVSLDETQLALIPPDQGNMCLRPPEHITLLPFDHIEDKPYIITAEAGTSLIPLGWIPQVVEG